MIKAELFGVNNNQIVPLFVCDLGRVTTSTSPANNREGGTAEIQGLLCGQYRNQLIPILVNEDGELEI